MKKFYIVVFLLCGLLFSGCGQTELKGLVSCSGVVLKDGQPLEDVTVTFVPISNDQQARGASGMTDKNGMFKAGTLQWNGILPGQYQVTLSKRITEINPGQESVPDNYKTVTYVEQMGKYADPKESGLTADIPKSGNNNLKFEIK
ncbi:MAG: carboxypeptidase-like regulatory domain-containing protein [Planctomycetaceae bacterium]|jgi:5-hydroxyisourate hydrolase-like protein (transthyretin family)|nr:carboxypeptidase-like regulatory domain-containing protein [Planctomycetaceae bacterium]